MNILIVSDKIENLNFFSKDYELLDAMDYLADPDTKKNKNVSLINLCDSYDYQKSAYYISLLAEARSQKVLPSSLEIQDIQDPRFSLKKIDHLDESIQKNFAHIEENTISLSIFLGQESLSLYPDLSIDLFNAFQFPFFEAKFEKNEKWRLISIFPGLMNDLVKLKRDFLFNAMNQYKEIAKIQDLFKQKPKNQKNFQKKQYKMAILSDPKEKTPPSNAKALENFVQIGEALGVTVNLINVDEYDSIKEYDSLFIRETTAVNHHTYAFARKAMNEGLIVMDDPNSILKCSNKVYLAELLNSYQIKTPETTILSRKNWQEKMKTMEFPCVLKRPDSAFSKGVVKINSKAEFKDKVNDFFQGSELLISQSFMPTEYDWRIGVLNNEVLFACQYFMAKNHWQIFNWDSPESQEGGFKAIPLNEVPDFILEAAMKSTQLIGDGLYGVDIKQYEKSALVIEINDNPNIDAGIEDSLVGEEIYGRIHQVFIDRIRKQCRYE